MKKIFFLGAVAFALHGQVFAQCNTSDATSCMCEDGTSTNCDLLPDIICAEPPLLVSGSAGVIEYSQTGNGSNNGRLRISVSTPNIGHGPLEVRTTNQYICGTDTITGTAPSTCPNSGLPPTQLLVQRVYHKDGSSMTYYERAAGSMTYHPSHGHMHVDDWGVFTLRSATQDPDPLNWPIVGNGAKLAFCLMDYGSCNTYLGHCVDSLGNTLSSVDFPNYGLGGASYSCSQVVQGISSGFTDIYYQGLDGMWIDIPPGTCNGNYFIVVELDPHNYFLEENEDNNVLVVPYTLVNQETAPQAVISSQSGTNTVCYGDSITLQANYGASYSYLWSTGETTQTVKVASSGTYTVSVTSPCGSNVSSPFQVIATGVPPVTTDDNVCVSGSGTLTASSTGDITWYDSPSGGNIVGTGSSYNTPSLSTSTTYYAETTDSIPESSDYAGPADNNIGTGGYFTGNQSLIFDALTGFELQSVKIFAQNAGDLTIELRSSLGTILDSVTVNVPSGESRVNLNWNIAAGTDLQLTRNGTFELFRNNGGVTYPYDIPGYVSIKNSTAGSDFYYFFYDWEITIPAQVCISPRSGATLHIRQLPKASISANGPTTFCRGDNVTLSAFVGTGYTYQWKKYGKILLGATNSNVTVTGNGKFRCQVTSQYGCQRVSNMIPVTALPPPTSVITASGPTDFCDGDSVTFTANSGTGFTYQWKKYGNFITGATGQSYTAHKQGKYKAVVTDQNGCARGSNHYFVNVNCRIAGTATSGIQASVYPNPSNGMTTVSYESVASGTIELSVSDLQGKTLLKRNVIHDGGQTTYPLDLTEMSQGMYIIMVSDGRNAARIPIVKQ